jgi:hypothetical protein
MSGWSRYSNVFSTQCPQHADILEIYARAAASGRFNDSQVHFNDVVAQIPTWNTNHLVLAMRAFELLYGGSYQQLFELTTQTLSLAGFEQDFSQLFVLLQSLASVYTAGSLRVPLARARAFRETLQNAAGNDLSLYQVSSIKS